MIEGYTTIEKIAEQWDITSKHVRCFAIKVKSLKTPKFGMNWADPSNAEKPENGRVTTREYKNLRNK